MRNFGFIGGIFAALAILSISNSFAKEQKHTQELSMLELSVANLHDGYVKAFSDVTTKAKLTQDQANWMKQRDSCKSNDACLLQMHRERQKLLQGKSSQMPYAGFFESKSGDMVLYPLEREYLTQIRAAEATTARWTCQVSGISSQGAKQLRFETLDRAKHLNIRAPSRVSLQVMPSEEALLLSRDYCGNGGVIEGTFVRVP